MRRLRDWVQTHFNLLVLAAVTASTYVAALNRAQALPWAIAALLTATLVAGLLWPRWLVGRLAVQRSGPTRAQEGQTVTFRVDVTNRGWLPRFMVELVDRLPFVGAAKGQVSSGEHVLGVIPYVPGSGHRSFDMPLVCEKRGFYRLGPVGLVSSFPLGLAQARRQCNGGVQTLTVYPDVFDIVDLPLRGAPSQIHRGGYLLPEGSGAAEFSGLRAYQRGDNPRHIHWPTTARRNELTVREFEPLASACLHVALDLDHTANVGTGREATFEYALRVAASIARHATTRGLRVCLSGEGAQPLHVAAGTGEGQYNAILDELAVADADGRVPYADMLSGLAMQVQPGETVVVFVAMPAQRLPQVHQALALLRARRAHLLAVLLRRETFAPERLADAPMNLDGLHSGLLDLGAHCLTVCKGDDLATLFNP